MKYKNSVILIVFFCGMFLLQIWVAQAQSTLNLKEMKPEVLRAMHKIMQIRNQAEQSESQESITQSGSTTNTPGKIAKKVKTAEKDTDFVWYNPWTWFK